MTDDNSSKYLRILSDLSSTITENTNQVENKINQHFDDIIKTLNTRRNELLDSINKSKSTLTDDINNEIKTIDVNDNLNSSQYLTDKLLSLSKSYQFNSDLNPSSMTNVGDIIETENNYIIPIITILSIQRDTQKSNHPSKCWIKIKWKMDNLTDINNNDAFKSILKFQKINDNDDNWMIAKYQSMNMNENNAFECTLEDNYYFYYDQEYLFKIEYDTAIPLKIKIYSDIKSIEFKSSENIQHIRSLLKYCNWYEYAPLNANVTEYNEWRERKGDILRCIKYIGDTETEMGPSRSSSIDWEHMTVDVGADNDEDDRERMTVKLNNVIKECHDNYMKFKGLNDRKLSYSLLDFIYLNQTKIERDKLWTIFDELQLDNIDMGIIEIIASYIASIYARAVNSSYVHFSYGSILPNKDIYDNVTFRQRERRIIITDDANPLYGEVIHIFERHHCDPTLITESTFSRFDVVIYYEQHNLYSITQIDDDEVSVEFVDFKLHRDFIQT